MVKVLALLNYKIGLLVAFVSLSSLSGCSSTTDWRKQEYSSTQSYDIETRTTTKPGYRATEIKLIPKSYRPEMYQNWWAITYKCFDSTRTGSDYNGYIYDIFKFSKDTSTHLSGYTPWRPPEIACSHHPIFSPGSKLIMFKPGVTPGQIEQYLFTNVYKSSELLPIHKQKKEYAFRYLSTSEYLAARNRKQETFDRRKREARDEFWRSVSEGFEHGLKTLSSGMAAENQRLKQEKLKELQRQTRRYGSKTTETNTAVEAKKSSSANDDYKDQKKEKSSSSKQKDKSPTFKWAQILLDGEYVSKYHYDNLKAAKSMLKTEVQNRLSELCTERYKGYIERDTIDYLTRDIGYKIGKGKFKLVAINAEGECRYRPHMQ